MSRTCSLLICIYALDSSFSFTFLNETWHTYSNMYKVHWSQLYNSMNFKYSCNYSLDQNVHCFQHLRKLLWASFWGNCYSAVRFLKAIIWGKERNIELQLMICMVKYLGWRFQNIDDYNLLCNACENKVYWIHWRMTRWIHRW